MILVGLSRLSRFCVLPRSQGPRNSLEPRHLFDTRAVFAVTVSDNPDRIAQKDSAMNRLLIIGSLTGLLLAATGCMQGKRGGGCNSGSCNSGDCNGGGQSRGLLGKLGGKSCGNGNCGGCGRTGCVAGPLGWQQGGLDYSSHLQPGVLGHQAAGQLQNQQFTPGPPSAQVGYPYYTVRGPRDFLLDNPPSIGR